MGEVWIEIVKELELENVEPLKDDKSVCDALLQRVKQCGEQTMELQLKLINSQRNMDTLDEQELYAEVRKFFFFIVLMLIIYSVWTNSFKKGMNLLFLVISPTCLIIGKIIDGKKFVFTQPLHCWMCDTKLIF